MSFENWLYRELDRLVRSDEEMDSRLSDQERLTVTLDHRMERIERLGSMAATILFRVLLAALLAANFLPEPLRTWITELGQR